MNLNIKMELYFIFTEFLFLLNYILFIKIFIYVKYIIWLKIPENILLKNCFLVGER